MRPWPLVENVNFRISTPLMAALQEKAKEMGVPVSEVIRRELRPLMTNPTDEGENMALPPLKTKAINVRAEPELAAALDDLAAGANTTRSELLRQLAKAAVGQPANAEPARQRRRNGAQPDNRKVLMCRVSPPVHKTMRVLAAEQGKTTQELLEKWVLQGLLSEVDFSAGRSPGSLDS